MRFKKRKRSLARVYVPTVEVDGGVELEGQPCLDNTADGMYPGVETLTQILPLHDAIALGLFDSCAVAIEPRRSIFGIK